MRTPRFAFASGWPRPPRSSSPRAVATRTATTTRRPTPTEAAPDVRGRHDDGRALRGRLDHRRHEVRPAAVRPGRARRRAGRASTSRSPRSSLASSASPRTSIEWVETISANREPFIEDGQVDIVVATYTINDERKQVVDFAGPYYVAGQTIMVLESNTDINGPDDLAGKTVCSAEGSTPAERIRTEYPEAELVPDRCVLRSASSRCATARSTP